MTSRIEHESETVRIGAFRSHPLDPDFRDSGPTRGHLLVFPREPVMITHAGGAPIVADPRVVMIYNAGQAYTRRAISPRGDRCEWFAYRSETVIEARVAHGARRLDEDRPFGALTHVPCTARSYLLARLGFESGDPLVADEVAATLLDEVLRPRAPVALAPAHVDLVDAVRRWLGVRYSEHRPLGTIARAHGVSVFHLARVVRRATGTSIHAYRNELRLRAALERLNDGEDVTTVALAVGFSSHSHFTRAFRRSFGVTPSLVRPSKIVTATRRLVAR